MLKNVLKTQEKSTKWISSLGFFLLRKRAAIKKNLNFSTSEITIGKPQRVYD